jgi:hypothetical protein
MLKLILVISFIMILFYLYPRDNKNLFDEGFENQLKDEKDEYNTECPNLLIKDGERIELLNTRQPRVPGVNPIYFENLEEYTEYYKYQKSKNQDCPVLFYQSTYDTQNKKGWRLLVNPHEPNAGMQSGPTLENTMEVKQLLSDANKHGKFNKKQFMSFDPDDQMIGLEEEIDTIDNPEDPMSKNWEGHEATHNALLSGKFAGRARKPDSNIFARNN